MATGEKISALNTTTAQSTDLIPIARDGANYSVTAASIAANVTATAPIVNTNGDLTFDPTAITTSATTPLTGTEIVALSQGGVVKRTTVDTFSDASEAQTLTTLAASSGSSLVGFTQAGSGTVSRTVQAKLRESVSITDFNITGNGVVDDTAGLVNALTEAAASSKELLIPPSINVKITSDITIPDNVKVHGGGTISAETSTFVYLGSGSGVVGLNLISISLSARYDSNDCVIVDNEFSCTIDTTNPVVTHMANWSSAAIYIYNVDDSDVAQPTYPRGVIISGNKCSSDYPLLLAEIRASDDAIITDNIWKTTQTVTDAKVTSTDGTLNGQNIYAGLTLNTSAILRVRNNNIYTSLGQFIGQVESLPWPYASGQTVTVGTSIISSTYNYYRVTVAGTLSTTSPTDTSGSPFTNGSATLVYDGALSGSGGTFNYKMSVNPESLGIYGANYWIEPSNFVVGRKYRIKSLGSTNWNTVAGTSAVTYQVNMVVTAVSAGSGDGYAVEAFMFTTPSTVISNTRAWLISLLGGRRNKITNNYLEGGHVNILFMPIHDTTVYDFPITDNLIEGNTLANSSEEGVSLDCQGDSNTGSTYLTTTINGTVNGYLSNTVTLTDTTGATNAVVNRVLTFHTGTLKGQSFQIIASNGVQITLGDNFGSSTSNLNNVATNGNIVTVETDVRRNKISLNSVKNSNIVLWGIGANSVITGNIVSYDNWRADRYCISITGLSGAKATLTGSVFGSLEGYSIPSNVTISNNQYISNSGLNIWGYTPTTPITMPPMQNIILTGNSGGNCNLGYVQNLIRSNNVFSGYTTWGGAVSYAPEQVQKIYSTQTFPRNINAHDLDIDGPMTRVSLTSPYSSAYGSYNQEFAYGTPVYFSEGWNGYKYWMASAPYPSHMTQIVSMTIASPAVFSSTPPPPAGTVITFSTTGALPTGLSTSTVYYVISTGLTDSTFQISTSVGGSAVNTSGTQSGTHTLHLEVGGQATISIASPAVITCAKSPPIGTWIYFSTTGALPTGLGSGAGYLVLSSGWTSTTFQITATTGGTAITTSGTQSGVHSFSVYAAKYENPYILVSNDGNSWVSPPNISQNPIYEGATVSTGTDGSSYYADPYITASLDRSKLYCIWLWSSRTGTIKQSIMCSESSDGLTWSSPVSISDSTSTAFSPNSPSLIPTSTGWTMIAIDTTSGSTPYIYTQTTSSTPYTGWTAPSTVYNGEWSQCSAVHPLSRTWWHQWTVPVEGGGLLSVASDSNNSGGTAWSLVSWDNGATWSVKALSYYKASAAGGQWYRPSLCVINDGGAQSLKVYASTIGWPRGPNSVEPGANGFYIYSARLKTDLTKTALQRALIRDAVNRNLTSPVALTTYGLLAWDSFNRASLGTTLESGQSWTVVTGAFTIVSNQLSCSTTGSIIMDAAVQNYDVEFKVITIPATPSISFIFNYQDNLNQYRIGLSNTATVIQKIVAGGQIYGPTNANIVFVANDVVRLAKRGPYYNLYINDRIALSYYDTYLQSKTVTGLYLSAGAVIDDFIVYQS